MSPAQNPPQEARLLPLACIITAIVKNQLRASIVRLLQFYERTTVEKYDLNHIRALIEGMRIPDVSRSCNWPHR